MLRTLAYQPSRRSSLPLSPCQNIFQTPRWARLSPTRERLAAQQQQQSAGLSTAAALKSEKFVDHQHLKKSQSYLNYLKIRQDKATLRDKQDAIKTLYQTLVASSNWWLPTTLKESKPTTVDEMVTELSNLPELVQGQKQSKTKIRETQLSTDPTPALPPEPMSASPPNIPTYGSVENEPWLQYFYELGLACSTSNMGTIRNMSTAIVSSESGLAMAATEENDSEISSKYAQKQSLNDHLPDNSKQQHVDMYSSLLVLQNDLYTAIKERNLPQAMRLYRIAIQNHWQDDLDCESLRSLFYLAERMELPLECFQLLKHYQKLTLSEQSNDLNGYTAMYERVCHHVRHFVGSQHLPKEIGEVINTLLVDVRQLDVSGKERCYPVLISSLYKLKAVFYSQKAQPLYDEMIASNFKVSKGYWEHLLCMPKYSQRHAMPIADILQRAIRFGRYEPDLGLLVRGFELLFPYANTNDTQIVLEAFVEYLTKRGKKQQTVPNQRFSKCILDVSVLEFIGAIAAKEGQSQICVLIWRLMDLMRCPPTVSILESTVVAFSAKTETSFDAFVVMGEMEKQGFVPSLALIRSVSVHMRKSLQHIQFASFLLDDLATKGRNVTVAMINTILSSYAEQGDIDHALYHLNQTFAKYKLQPNADSFNFVFEALGKNTRRGVPEVQQNWVLRIADKLLTDMEDRGFEPDHHTIRNYVEVLCLTGELDTATKLVYEARERNSVLRHKTIFRVATAHTDLHQYDTAREVAACAYEPLHVLLNIINKRERKAKLQIATQSEHVHDDEEQSD